MLCAVIVSCMKFIKTMPTTDFIHAVLVQNEGILLQQKARNFINITHREALRAEQNTFKFTVD